MAVMTIATIAAAGCDREPSTGVEGTFELTVSIHTDTCTGQATAFGSEVTIERTDDNVTFRFGNEATLTGTIDPESRIMTVSGMIVIQDPEGGTFTGEMRFDQARVTEDEIHGFGSITFEGTFPGVPGTCQQLFNTSGLRESRSPLPLTGS
jgi:hypothetical protein